MTILDAIEALGEAAQDAGVDHATVYIQVDSDADVDRLHASLGRLVGATGELAPEHVVFEGSCWRRSKRVVAGVAVTISGPHTALAGARREAA
jgi:hypothetical protein